VGVLGMRKVGVKMIEPNNSLAEARAAILKPIIRDAVNEALASAAGGPNNVRWMTERS